jgi:hypothetical protein
VPFIRRSRDRKGYESTTVLHQYRPAQGPQRTRVLYLFRTPSHVKVGRPALDDEAMEALEHTHPDLSFDWTVLLREPAEVRTDRWERPARPGRRPDRTGRPGREERPSAPQAPTTEAVLEDATVLGRTIGASDAARWRQRYSDLELRIGRRARTPEERDRLLERLGRLNPDDWADEAAVRTGMPVADAEMTAIGAELPGRRRRRGGRLRNRPDEGQPAATDGSSAIMDEDGGVDAISDDSDASEPDRGAGAPRDDGGLGAEPDAGSDPAPGGEPETGF